MLILVDEEFAMWHCEFFINKNQHHYTQLLVVREVHTVVYFDKNSSSTRIANSRCSHITHSCCWLFAKLLLLFDLFCCCGCGCGCGCCCWLFAKLLLFDLLLWLLLLLFALESLNCCCCCSASLFVVVIINVPANNNNNVYFVQTRPFC